TRVSGHCSVRAPPSPSARGLIINSGIHIAVPIARIAGGLPCRWQATSFIGFKLCFEKFQLLVRVIKNRLAAIRTVEEPR
ncbi:MAG: hypothetical protein ABI779_03230, partial [Acidobacteriota bacterium]